MGTQQLLIVVLGIMIVGIAVSIAVSIFGTNAEQANQDAMVQDCMRIISAGQAYHSKPTMLGGGGNNFKGMLISDCGMQVTDKGYGKTLNGEYEIMKANSRRLIVIGRSSANPEQTVTISLRVNRRNREDRITFETNGWN